MSWDEDGLEAVMPSSLSCCNECLNAAGNVDMFYWPKSGVNADCLSIIGTSHRPVDEGFFTSDRRWRKEYVELLRW